MHSPYMHTHPYVRDECICLNAYTCIRRVYMYSMCINVNTYSIVRAYLCTCFVRTMECLCLRVRMYTYVRMSVVCKYPHASAYVFYAYNAMLIYASDESFTSMYITSIGAPPDRKNLTDSLTKDQTDTFDSDLLRRIRLIP
jgi:hypothetical protein